MIDDAKLPASRVNVPNRRVKSRIALSDTTVRQVLVWHQTAAQAVGRMTAALIAIGRWTTVNGQRIFNLLAFRSPRMIEIAWLCHREQTVAVEQLFHIFGEQTSRRNEPRRWLTFRG